MKKIAVVTIYDTNNYGNRLQNYAVGKTLENMGYKVETLVPVQREAEKSFKKYIANILAYFFPHFFSKLNSNFVRRINFIKFNKSHIKTRFIITDDGIFSDKIANKYDRFNRENT